MNEFFFAIFSTNVSDIGWTQMLNLGLMRQVLDHCATTTLEILVR
jgi:hypothetical protein